MLLQNWWYTTLLNTNSPIQPPLRKDIEADVLIIGAGVAGIAAAYYYIDKGLKVVMLERNIFGGSSSGKCAGFLTPDSELELSQLIRRYGKEGAKDLWKVPTQGIEILKDAILSHQIDCDFQVQDSLFLGIGNSGWKDIQDEMKSRNELGFDQILYDESEIKKVIGSEGYSGGVRYKNTYGINGLQYCQGMKKVLLEQGIQIYEATEVLSIQDHTAFTHLGSVKANQIIFCADKLEHRLTPYADDVFHAQTFLSISEPLSDESVRSIFPQDKFQCWDSTLAYSYFRLTGANRLLLGGGSIATTYLRNNVNSPIVIDEVIREFRNKFPQLEDLKFIQYWPGLIDSTRDLIPTVLKDEKSPWIHFVFGCVGLPWATFCGDFCARHAYDTNANNDHHYYKYFSKDRSFFVPIWLERIFGKPLVFSLNNAWAKYFQKDI